MSYPILKKMGREPAGFHALDAGRLIRGGRLHVGLRYFDDDVPIVIGQKPRQIVYKVSRSNRLELDVNFEERTVLTHKSAAL